MNASLLPANDDKQRLRLQRVLLTAASSTVTIIITLMVAWFGYVPVYAAIGYVIAVLIVIAFFFALFRSGLNRRFADPRLIVPQMVAAGIVTSYIAFEGHAARPAFIFFYLIAFMFGVFALDTRRLILVAVFYLACYTGVAGLSMAVRPESTEVPREIFRIVVIAVMFVWMIVLGQYIFGLRWRLSNADAEVTRLLREQRLVFDTATVGIAHVRERIIIDCNAHFLAMFGYSREEVIGQWSRILYLSETSWDQINTEIYAALAEGHPARREIMMRDKMGKLMTCGIVTESLYPRQPERGIVTILNDVTDARRHELELRRALLEQMAIFKNAPAGIVFTRRRVVEDCNDMVLKLFGYSHEEWVGQSTRRVFASDEEWQRIGLEQSAAFARGESYSYEMEFVRKNGEKIWCKVRGGAIDPDERDEGSIVYIIVDVTDRKHAEAALRQSREQLAQVIHASQSGIWDYDLETGDIHFSGRLFQILGLPVTTESASIMPISNRLHPADAKRVMEAFKEHLRDRAPLDVEFRLRREDDTYVWVRGFGQASWNEKGRAYRFVGSIIDISQRKHQEEEIRRLALHDPLTGLPNRRLLEDRLEKALGTARRNGTQISVMLLDLDGFKAVNDEHGHEAGDIVLRAVAERLSGSVRESDTVARTGGDEFVVLMEGQRQAEDAVTLANKILADLREPILAGDYRFQVTASIGIAVCPADSESAAQLIRMADKAMYGVKESGRDGFRFHAHT